MIEFIHAYPVLSCTIGIVVAFNLGMLVGAWWNGKPLSNVELRIAEHEIDAHEELTK
jgi:hypothetical protein